MPSSKRTAEVHGIEGIEGSLDLPSPRCSYAISQHTVLVVAIYLQCFSVHEYLMVLIAYPFSGGTTRASVVHRHVSMSISASWKASLQSGYDRDSVDAVESSTFCARKSQRQKGRVSSCSMETLNKSSSGDDCWRCGTADPLQSTRHPARQSLCAQDR